MKINYKKKWLDLYKKHRLFVSKSAEHAYKLSLEIKTLRAQRDAFGDDLIRLNHEIDLVRSQRGISPRAGLELGKNRYGSKKGRGRR